MAIIIWTLLEELATELEGIAREIHKVIPPSDPTLTPRELALLTSLRLCKNKLIDIKAQLGPTPPTPPIP